MNGIAGFDARGAVDASGVPIAPADLPETLKPAPRSKTLEVIKRIQHENDAPNRCQQHDAD